MCKRRGIGRALYVPGYVQMCNELSGLNCGTIIGTIG